MDHLWNYTDREKLKYWGGEGGKETLLQFHFIDTKSHGYLPGIEPTESSGLLGSDSLQFKRM